MPSLENISEDQKRKIFDKVLRQNFPVYAQYALKYLPKSGLLTPFKLNKAQQHVHDCIEKQLAETGRVRTIIVKGRQQGISTYVEGRFMWKMTLNQSVRAFTVANKSNNTEGLFKMAKLFYDKLPTDYKPALGTCNGYEMNFPGLLSGIRISSAGSDEVGRGLTITHLHGSEIASWTDGDEIISSLFQAVPPLPGTEIILESTAKGPTGLFDDLVKNALDGSNGYQVIFVPWFWEPIYRSPVPQGFELTAAERDYMTAYELDLEQIVWRRETIAGFKHGLTKFRQEYPATREEAFAAGVEGALWSHEMLNEITEEEYSRRESIFGLEDTVVAFDPAGSSANEKSDESGFCVASRLGDGNAYILEDASGHYPEQKLMPSLASLYYRHDADRIIIETNGVGDWIPTMVRNEDPGIVVRKVRATKGKRLRAEPVAHAYTQNRVFHVRSKNKHLTDLEAEMCSWKQGDKSPNRVDAMVYAVLDLLKLDEPKGKNYAPIMSSFLD